MKVIAHRGLPVAHPENTMPSFEAALTAGARFLECDAWISATGDVVVCHDEHVKGLGGRSVQELTTDELGAVEIPKLYDVMLCAAGKAVLVIELKGPGTADATAACIEQCVKEEGTTYDDYVVSSYKKTELLRFMRVAPAVPAAVLVWGTPSTDELDVYASWGAHALHVDHDNDDITESLVRQAHDRTMEVWAYTVNDVEKQKHLDSIGVDGIFTDDVRMFL